MALTLTGRSNKKMLELKKNDVLDLAKREPGLKRIVVGLGWDINSKKSINTHEYDLDVSAFALGAGDKLIQISDVCFYNNKNVRNCIRLPKDNRDGSGEGDDEQIIVELNKVPEEIKKIIFVATIFEAEKRFQNFGQVKNAYICLRKKEDDKNKICNFSLTENFSTETGIIFSEVYRREVDNEWEYKAVGEGFVGDMNDLAGYYS